MQTARSYLDNILIDARIVTKDQLKAIHDEKMYSQKSVIDVLCELELASRADLLSQLRSLLEIQYGVNFIDLSRTEVEIQLLNIISQEVMKLYKFLPVKRSGNIFTIAMVEPDNILAEREIKSGLREFKNITIKKAVIFEDDFNKFVQEHFSQREERVEIIEHDTDELLSSMGIDLIESSADKIELADLTDSAQAPIIQLANSILGVAISRGISDIHIEPGENELTIRYRQDGVLSKYKSLPKKIQNALVSRYKIMAELDISERRLPQDGRIRVRMNNKYIDFRVSTLPNKFGEKIVMRILDKSNISFGLEQLITDKETLKIIREMICRPFGIIFVTGPTGSGKTTTLYSALSERNTPEVNISTAEDPIEYDLPGITQTEVNKTIGMDFAKILKSFLRQDPDIMLVGETRDKETAKISVEAALTGNLVFTTLHTNDAPSSIIRLQEMDVDPVFNIKLCHYFIA